jgi:SRSO17 transposase
MEPESDVEVGLWDAELESLLLRVGERFGRVEPRRRTRDYVRGLLGPVGRKNSWQLAEHAGNATPYGLQRLLSWCQWEPDEIRDDLQNYVAERLGQPDVVLIVDDTGFLKKGIVSAGVQRQYSGTAGARISTSARQRGVGGSLRYDSVSVRPRCRSCCAGQVRSDPAVLR